MCPEVSGLMLWDADVASRVCCETGVESGLAGIVGTALGAATFEGCLDDEVGGFRDFDDGLMYFQRDFFEHMEEQSWQRRAPECDAG